MKDTLLKIKVFIQPFEKYSARQWSEVPMTCSELSYSLFTLFLINWMSVSYYSFWIFKSVRSFLGYSAPWPWWHHFSRSFLTSFMFHEKPKGFRLKHIEKALYCSIKNWIVRNGIVFSGFFSNLDWTQILSTVVKFLQLAFWYETFVFWFNLKLTCFYCTSPSYLRVEKYHQQTK